MNKTSNYALHIVIFSCFLTVLRRINIISNDMVIIGLLFSFLMVIVLGFSNMINRSKRSHKTLVRILNEEYKIKYEYSLPKVDVVVDTYDPNLEDN